MFAIHTRCPRNGAPWDGRIKSTSSFAISRRDSRYTANESFLRASFTENVPEEQLLMNPLRRASCQLAPPADGQAGSLPYEFRNEPHSDFSRADSSAVNCPRTTSGSVFAVGTSTTATEFEGAGESAFAAGRLVGVAE